MLFFDTHSNGPLAAIVPVSDSPAIQCFNDGNGAGFNLTHCSGTLAPGQGVTLTLSYPAVGGTFVKIDGNLDPTHILFEANETNNDLAQSVVVTP